MNGNYHFWAWSLSLATPWNLKSLFKKKYWSLKRIAKQLRIQMNATSSWASNWSFSIIEVPPKPKGCHRVCNGNGFYET